MERLVFVRRWGFSPSSSNKMGFELSWGIQIEGVPRYLNGFGFESRHFPIEFDRHFCQSTGVDQDASALHVREDPRQGKFDLL